MHQAPRLPGSSWWWWPNNNNNNNNNHGELTLLLSLLRDCGTRSHVNIVASIYTPPTRVISPSCNLIFPKPVVPIIRSQTQAGRERLCFDPLYGSNTKPAAVIVRQRVLALQRQYKSRQLPCHWTERPRGMFKDHKRSMSFVRVRTAELICRNLVLPIQASRSPPLRSACRYSKCHNALSYLPSRIRRHTVPRFHLLPFEPTVFHRL